MQYLDLEHPSIRQSLSATAGSLKRARFVEVDVSAVNNPKRYGLTFEVFFERDGAAPVRLGTFSLYPADNPGKFIVPASGKLTAPGSLIVSMIITDPVDPSAPSPKVAVGKISLVE